jgi:hypothetical protein
VLPDPGRQHRLDGHAQEDVEAEKDPRLRLQHGEGQDAEVIPVLGKDEAVEQSEDENGAGQEDAEGHHHPGAREQYQHGDQQQEERGVGE